MVFKYILLLMFIIKKCNCGGVALDNNEMTPNMKRIDKPNVILESNVDNVFFSDYPCKNNTDVISYFTAGLYDGYVVRIFKKFNIDDVVRMTFDLEASVSVDNRFFHVLLREDDSLELQFVQPTEFAEFKVRGDINIIPPYLVGLKINGEEFCSDPSKDYFRKYPVGTLLMSETERYCGRRRYVHNQLIFGAMESMPGRWPWHAAIYARKNGVLKYQCGGTVYFKNYLVTAAHCATVRGQAISPEKLSIFLGEVNLVNDDNETTQEIEVEKVIVHEQFKYKTLDDDIALIKLKTQPFFNAYVQPACVWYEDLNQIFNDGIVGTVIGWGFHNENYSLSNNLREATMPIVSDSTCMRSKPTFFPNILANEKKFCAGYRNGTSVCNGDSGGGLFVFLPYGHLSEYANVQNLGAWYIRGIVSLSLSGTGSDYRVCDPNEYVVFTDIAKYRNWMIKNTK